MNRENLALAGAVAVLLYVLWDVRRANAAEAGRVRDVTPKPGTLTADDAGWGWRYYDDGVAIGPDGAYYKYGAAAWRPEGVE